jgi:hypothetical protein
MSRKTLFEHVGGTAGLHGLEDYPYVSVLADSLLKPLFGAGSRAAQQNLNAGTDGNRHPLRKVSISTGNGDEKDA